MVDFPTLVDLVRRVLTTLKSWAEPAFLTGNDILSQSRYGVIYVLVIQQ
jgi:hypothetical protein